MSRFTVLLAVLLLCAAALGEEPLTKEHAKEVAHECQAESSATDEDVAQLMKHEPAASHEAKCLRACVMKKFEIMDESGKMVKANAINLVKAMSKHDADKEAAGIEIVDQCEAIETPEDHCDAAAAYATCLHEHLHEHGLSLEEH